MLSVRARDAARESRPGAAPFVFLFESGRDAVAACRRHARVVRRAAVFALLAGGAVASTGVLLPAGRTAFIAGTLAGAVATALFVAANAGLLRGPGGTPLERFGVANCLTLSRLILIAPVCVLLAEGRAAAALATYAVLVVTDVADGIVARRRGETSEFGVVVDPLADVLSTFAVFTVFLVDNLVPLWLYLLLAGRYAMLLLGSLVLFATVGPVAYRATVPGKVVGVIQATGAGLLMLAAARGGPDWPYAGRLFAVLGLGFASIVVSQGVIGWRHIRHATRGRAVRSGSTR
ncbi:MAG TPA: CDP-alcohol phosphatidyltransferase family protein [Candidatus Krumholzibacteria bacterium]|nr:CDP-alcohol phosphatidyltransferase family protein [Candidatus Krumholzibacteria bacterium]